MTARTTLPVALTALLGGALALAACAGGSSGSSGDPATGPAGDGGAGSSDAAPDVEDGFDGNTTPACITAVGVGLGAAPFVDDADKTQVTATGGPGCKRTFALSTTAPQRDGRPQTRTVAELAGWPSVQTGSDLFDALYTLALEETREAQVGEIKDGAFNGGAAIPCGKGGCFETGKLWTYVWTRDTAYSMHLGLAALDPLRARTSLLFKVSPKRAGFSSEIVQDTGTGGSWPVSTDRVVWALGAWETLKFLDGKDRDDFRDAAYEALRGTLERDRAVVFDPVDGLYRGEQSFLDWREQSYPGWVNPDLAHVAQSKALSTNALHLQALTIGAALAREKGDGPLEQKLGGWAKDLAAAIRAKLWLGDEKMYSTYITTFLDPAPARRYDLLGSALVVLGDVATPEQARQVLSGYPHLPKGPPVIWPQQRATPIYHNRAIWPFVTAYELRAAKKARHDGAATLAARSLVRGAAQNLSNMENLEVVSGRAWVDDGALSGPVVNSTRQLWSVAGYVSMVHDVLFGLDASQEGIRFQPYVPKRLRKELLGGVTSIALNDFPYKGKRVSVVVKLPPVGANEDGAYAITRVRLNGKTVGDAFVSSASLAARNTYEIELGDAAEASAPARVVTPGADDRLVYAPRTPAASVALAGGKLELAIDLAGEPAAGVTISVYRDGVRVAKDLPGSTATWVDPATSATSPSYCYAVEVAYANGNVSQRSSPQCYWGPGYVRAVEHAPSELTAVGGSWTTDYGRSFYQAWGDPGHKLTLPSFTAASTGEHLVQVSYGNGAGPINTGITCGLKLARVEDATTGAVVGQGYLVMPQRGAWSSWGDSTFVRASLTAGKSYRVVLEGDASSQNMSDLLHFASYTGGTGGSGGAFFRVNVGALKILARSP